MCNQCAGLGDHLQPAEILGKTKITGLGNNRMRDPYPLLTFLRQGQPMRQRAGRDAAERGQKAGSDLTGDADGLRLPVLATFHQQRIFRAGRIAEATIIAQAFALGMAGIDHDMRRVAQLLRKADALVERAGQNQRSAGFVHGVQVEQKIHTVDQRTQRPRPCQFCALARTFEYFR